MHRFIYIFLILILASCAENPTEPPEPVSYFYWIAPQDGWTDCELDGTWTSPHGFTLRNDCLFYSDDVNSDSWAIADMKQGGGELYFATRNKAHTFRGTMYSDKIDGYMMNKGINGRYGPAFFTTFKRAN